jgi:hypothetical protein
MRKALIGLILAATAMVPAAAQAQNWHNRDGGRGEHGRDGGEARSERVQQSRQERQAQQAQPAPQQQVQQAPQVQVVERQRGDNGNRGNGQGRNDGGNRGNWQGRGDAGAGNAQSGAENRGNWRGRGGNQGGNQGSIYPQAWQGNPNDPRLRHYQELERRNQQGYDRRDNRNDRGDSRANDRRDNRNDRSDWRGNDRGSRNWNRDWRNDNRYDWQRYRYSNRNAYHIGPYYSPYRGYGYNRFSIGVFLDPFFYDQQYWIGDPWQYRLPPAEPGTEWVRYYNDVLLVDVYTGEVLDTIYDFFW